MNVASPSDCIDRPSHVLVVDDDPMTCELIQALLSKKGYKITVAGDAADGLDIVNHQDVDLVVSDMIMPGLSGFELLTELKKLHPLLPVIIITAKPKVDAAVACIKTGAFDYLTKPLDPKRFIEHVETGLEALEKVRESNEDRPERFLTRWRTIHGYDLVKVLGEGGLGIVFLAIKKDEETGESKRFALKVLRPDVLQGADMFNSLERFMREAELASAVKHPNVIRIYDYGLAQEEEIPYMVMEYIEGKPLSHYIINNDELNYEQKAFVLRQAAEALAAVHASRMYHRDIKPDNILVSEDLHVTLTDFGIATTLSSQRLTSTGFVVGSPAYMSPELFAHKQADARSDIFSLGAVAYELMVGVAPFDGETITDLSNSIRHEDPPDARKIDHNLPVGLQRIVSKMLAKNPRRRYQSARSVVIAFDEYLNPNSLLKALIRKLGQ